MTGDPHARGSIADREANRWLMKCAGHGQRALHTGNPVASTTGARREARRFELMQRNLPSVRSERQLIAEALRAERAHVIPKGDEPARWQ